jgi:hypothetical protein
MVFEDKRKNGGKIAVKHVNQLLNESYKNKDRTNTNKDNKLELDNNLFTDKMIKQSGSLGNDPQVKNVITLNKPTTTLDLIKRNEVNDRQYDIRSI